MLDTLPPISSLEIKGENHNIFQINLDNSENSTRESHQECENSKCCEDASDFIKSEEDLFLEPKASKKKFEGNFFLHKKRENNAKKKYDGKEQNR